MSKNDPFFWRVFLSKQCSHRLPKVLRKWITNRSKSMPWPTWGQEGHPDPFLIDFWSILDAFWFQNELQMRPKSIKNRWCSAMWCPRTSHMSSGAKSDKILIDVGVILTQRWCPKWSRSIACSCHFVGLLISLKTSFQYMSEVFTHKRVPKGYPWDC